MAAIIAAFIDWAGEANMRRPIAIVPEPSATSTMTFRLEGYHPASLGTSIEGILSAHDLSIAVHHQGQAWDLLFSEDCVVHPVTGGFVCALCPPEHQQVFTHREALWREHWFDSLERWISESLIPADRLALLGDADHATWARLLKPGEHPDSKAVIAILSLPFHAPEATSPTSSSRVGQSASESTLLPATKDQAPLPQASISRPSRMCS